jgi:FtsZ-interacting cell division protein ZipA
MGIETILIVLGVVFVVAVLVVASRTRRKATGAQAPKTDAPSGVKPRE